MVLQDNQTQGIAITYLGYMLHDKRSSIINLLKKDKVAISNRPSDEELRLAVIDGIANNPQFKKNLTVFLITNASKQFATEQGKERFTNAAGPISLGQCLALYDDGCDDFQGDFHPASQIRGWDDTPTSNASKSSGNFWDTLGGVFNNEDTIKNIFNSGLSIASSKMNQSAQQKQYQQQQDLLNTQLQIAQANAAAAAAAAGKAKQSNTPTWVWPVVVVTILAGVGLTVYLTTRKKAA